MSFYTKNVYCAGWMSAILDQYVNFKSVNCVMLMIEQNHFTVSICAPRGIHQKI